MKIKKILEIIEPQVSSGRYSGSFSGGYKGDYESKDSMSVDKGTVGRGLFSTVKADKDPHMVKKYTTNFEEDDVFDLYVRFIIKNKLHENPYFPRIYNFKEIRDKEGKPLYKYQIEKLQNITNLEKPELEFIIDKLFGNGFFEKHLSGETKRSIIYELANAVETAIENDVGNKIKDDDFKKAAKLIRMFAKSKKCPNCRIDLHQNNIMARRTPYGVQLVITDPVASEFT